MSGCTEADLRNLVLEGNRVVAFVGAGVSKPAGKDWYNTVKDIADHCRVQMEVTIPKSEKYLRDIIDECTEASEPLCNEKLRELFAFHSPSVRPAMLHLLKLDFRAIVTTNFDPWLWMHSEGSRYRSPVYYPHLPLSQGIQGGLYYLHGFFRSEDRGASIRDLVFGAKSFRNAYEGSLLPGFLLNLFTYEDVLFVGCDPTEEYLSKILVQSISIRRKVSGPMSTPKRFILWPQKILLSEKDAAEQDAMIAAIQAMEIDIIPYDPKGADYLGLDELLWSWIQTGNMKNRPAPIKGGLF